MADSFLKGHAFEAKTMAREFLDIAMGTEKGPVDNAEMTEVWFERRGGRAGWGGRCLQRFYRSHSPVPACRTPTPPLTPATRLDRPATMYLSIRMCMRAYSG
jgi:hypothetical protein